MTEALLRGKQANSQANKITVLHLLDTDAFAGTERHVIELMKAISNLSAKPILGCRVASALERTATSSHLQMAACWKREGMIGFVTGMLAVRRLIRDESIDIIHSHNGRTSLVAACVSLFTGVVGVTTQHFIQPQFTSYRGPKRVVASIMHNLVNHQLSRVICVSDAAKKAMLAREKIPAAKLITVPNGIQPLTPASAYEVAGARRDLGIADDELMVISVCRLEPEKGLDYLIAAFAKVVQRNNLVKLVLAGEGSLRENLELRVRELSLINHVKFIGFRDDVDKLIAASDIFVLPSPAEPFGLAVLEAMSVSKVVVACNAGGPAEILRDKIDGRLVNPQDVTALENAIAELIADPDLRRTLGAQGFVTFQRRFTSETMAQKTMAVYRSTLNLNESAISSTDGHGRLVGIQSEVS